MNGPVNGSRHSGAPHVQAVTEQRREREIRAPGQAEVGGTSGQFGLDRDAVARRTGLRLAPQMSLEAWLRIGRQLYVISDSSAWWWGDWLIFGTERFPDRYQRAIAETALDYQTLRNYAWVARRFEVARRRDKLSFQHHVVVATLSDAEQDAWLTRAEENGWSRNELRRQLRATRRGVVARPESLVVYQLNIDRERQARWQQAASRAKRDLVDWMMASLDRVAADVLNGKEEHP
jgi:hypothetical protein